MQLFLNKNEINSLKALSYKIFLVIIDEKYAYLLDWQSINY